MWEFKWEEERKKKKLRKMAEIFGSSKTQVRAIKSQLAVRKWLRPFVLICVYRYTLCHILEDPNFSIHPVGETQI
jgi:hypothetical protein